MKTKNSREAEALFTDIAEVEKGQAFTSAPKCFHMLIKIMYMKCIDYLKGVSANANFYC